MLQNADWAASPVMQSFVHRFIGRSKPNLESCHWQRTDPPELPFPANVQSRQGWMRQYNVENGKPMPFDSKPKSAFKVYMQRTCAQLGENGFLFKCPALAHFAQLEPKLKLQDVPAWQLFRDYKAISPNATDDELRTFIETKAIPHVVSARATAPRSSILIPCNPS
jgi:hypothetical protein